MKHYYNTEAVGIYKDLDGVYRVANFRYCPCCGSIRTGSIYNLGTLEQYENRTLPIICCEDFIEEWDLFFIDLSNEPIIKYKIEDKNNINITD